MDYKLIEGGHPKWHYPHIPGVDGAGEVIVVGENVSDWQPGDRVCFHTYLVRNGSFAEYTTVPAHVLARIPEKITWASAAAIPCAGYTAYQAIHRKLHLQPDETILIQGGSGGVGGFAVQFAKLAGARVITTCSAAKQNYVTELGADLVLNYRQDDLHKGIMEFTEGLGVQAVLDTVGSPTAKQSLAWLRYNGQIVCIAGSPNYAEAQSLRRAVSLHEVNLGGVYSVSDIEAQRDLA